METIINIIANAENSPLEWMIFICFAIAGLLAIAGVCCWVGDALYRKFTNNRL